MTDREIYNPFVSFALSSSAGSGKTFALTTRLIAMLLSGARVSDILVVTFTNLAANDIRRKLFERIFSLQKGNDHEAKLFSEVLHEPVSRILEKGRELTTQLITQFSLFQISTIHSFFTKVLKSFPRETGLIPDIVIIDEALKENILQEAIEGFYGSLKEDADLLNRVFNFATHYRESGIATGGTICDIYGAIESKKFALKDLISIQEGVEGAYDEFMRKKNVFFSAEMTQRVQFLLNALSDYRDRYGGNRNVDSFSKGLEFFLKYRNINRLAGLTPFKKGMVRYLEKVCTAMPYETAQHFTQTLSHIGSAFTSYLYSQMRYYVFTWLDMYVRINNIYTDMKRARHRLDFSDIEEYTLRFLSQLSDFDYFYYRLGSEVKYILIDEFQDTSEIQWETLRHLVQEALKAGGNFFYVGDEKQSIYRWRGGEPYLFEMVRSHLHLQKKSLRFSYRQNKVLLSFVNAVFKNIQNNLWSSYRYEDQKIPQEREGLERGYVTVVECENRERLLNELVQQIRNLQAEGIELHDMAILCRKNSEIEDIEKYFLKNHIPCRTEGKSRLLQDYSIMDIVNIMNLVMNPAEAIYLGGFLRSPLARFSYDGIYSLQDEDGEISFKKLKGHSPVLHGRLVRLIHQARFLSISEFIRNIYEELNVLHVYREKKEVLLKLLDLAYTFENSSESTLLYDFLKYLQENKDYLTLQLSEERGVLLLTIHAAKGLEFHTVIVPFLNQPFNFRLDGSLLFQRNEEGKITSYSIAKSLYRDYFSNMDGMNELDHTTDINYKTDELNVLYVALTRAKENLIVLPQKRGGGLSIGEVLITSLDPSKKDRVTIYRMFSGQPVPSFTDSCDRAVKKKMLALKFVDTWKHEVTVRPEKAVEEETEVSSGEDMRSKRIGLLKGLIFHRALESITHLTIDDGAMKRLLGSALACEGVMYTITERENALAAAHISLLHVITDGRIAKYFGPRARSEALFISKVQPNFIGRIDKVYVDDEVEVLDFKTNQVFDKKHLERLISWYRDQVISYCRSMTSIYPHKRTKGYLYFTDADYNSRIVQVH